MNNTIKTTKILAFVSGGISLAHAFLVTFHIVPLGILAFLILLGLGITSLVFTLKLGKEIKGKTLILIASIMTIAGFIIGWLPYINALYLIATGLLFLFGGFQLTDNFIPVENQKKLKYIISSVLCGVLGIVTLFTSTLNLGRIVSSFPTSSNDYSTKPGTTTKPESTKKNETKPETKKENGYAAGTYKVGSDLPAGEYVLESTGTISSYIEANSNSSGSFDSIIFNDNVSTILYFTVNEGEYLKFKNGNIYPADKAQDIVKKYIGKEGMFKVGHDIPAGEYRVTATSSTSGYFEVNSDSSHDFSSIITNEIVTDSDYITVTDGQYLQVSRATFEQV